jgi:hypothetical protein
LISRAASSRTARIIHILSSMLRVYRPHVTSLSQNRVPKLILVHAWQAVMMMNAGDDKTVKTINAWISSPPFSSLVF